jgi:hypothetical protein
MVNSPKSSTSSASRVPLGALDGVVEVHPVAPVFDLGGADALYPAVDAANTCTRGCRPGDGIGRDVRLDDQDAAGFEVITHAGQRLAAVES